MSCTDCVNRRKFLALAAAAGASAALAGCGDGELSGVGMKISGNPMGTGTGSGPTGSPSSQITLKVADYPELGQPNVLVMVADTFIAVKRSGLATFTAFSMSCTHQGCLTTLVNGNRFDCPCHFSQFDVNGMVIRGPATDPLTEFPTSYDAATDILTIN